ncbi:hypothetical protein CLRAG_33490 [Clostridium ragsdalei P11]|uniref:Uncharacterized protein n=1 Tax=Clostridium ragsdalei P11 TaxID=1353534 RepID=A0A1A6AKX8_9CLOT|nr:hypothetical protein [Clostridium ragsdalei]OBR90701.1 hypothetical protein CLRAG_33490 [Clostridium ragsdalei P11]
MSNIFEVKKEQLQDKLGEIVPFDYVPQQGEDKQHVFTAYIEGTIPVRVRSKLTYEEFCRIC